MYKFTIRTLLYLCVGIMSFYACSREDDLNKQDEIPDFSGITDNTANQIVAVDSGRVSWHDHYSVLLKSAQEGNSLEDEQLAIFAKKQLEWADSLTNATIEASGGNGADDGAGGNVIVGYEYVRINYRSVDEYNRPITLSELVIWPYNWFWNPHPDNIVIGCHVTITSDKESPSNYVENSLWTDVGMLTCHARSTMWGVNYGNLVVIPDYQGYGASRYRTHPYIYQELTARQVVDGAYAAKTYYTTNKKSMEDDWKSFAVGYSQGGSTAMAVHRYIEQNNLTNSLRFKGSICGDGPYDPVATVKDYIKNEKVYMPIALGLIIKGLCDSNPHTRGKYKPSDYFTWEFLNTGIIDWIESKNYTTNDIQDNLLEYSINHKDGCFYMMAWADDRDEFMEYTSNNKFRSDGNLRRWTKGTGDVYCTIDQVIRPEVIEYFLKNTATTKNLPKLKALEKALEMNNVLRGWSPAHPMYVFHSTRDEVVPFVNYESTSAAFSGSYYFKGRPYKATNTYLHNGTGSAFYMWYESSYVESILSGTWSKDPYEYTEGGHEW